MCPRNSSASRETARRNETRWIIEFFAFLMPWRSGTVITREMWVFFPITLHNCIRCRRNSIGKCLSRAMRARERQLSSLNVNCVVTLTCQGLCMIDGCHAPNHWQSTISSTLLATLCWCPSVHRELGLGLRQVHCYSIEKKKHAHTNQSLCTLELSHATYTPANSSHFVAGFKLRKMTHWREHAQNVYRRITNDLYCAKFIFWRCRFVREKSQKINLHFVIGHFVLFRLNELNEKNSIKCNFNSGWCVKIDDYFWELKKFSTIRTFDNRKKKEERIER